MKHEYFQCCVKAPLLQEFFQLVSDRDMEDLLTCQYVDLAFAVFLHKNHSEDTSFIGREELDQSGTDNAMARCLFYIKGEAAGGASATTRVGHNQEAEHANTKAQCVYFPDSPPTNHAAMHLVRQMQQGMQGLLPWQQAIIQQTMQQAPPEMLLQLYQMMSETHQTQEG